MARESAEEAVPANVDIQLKEIKDGTMEKAEDDVPFELKVYRRRWLMLAVVALLNNLNTVGWIAFAPVSNYVNYFYGEDSAAWFSMIYMMMTVPVGIFAMWAGGSFGTRISILIAATANGLGSLIRMSSSFLPFQYRFYVGIVGQGIAAIAYPFIMYLPSKVSNSWFPHNQRALATMIATYWATSSSSSLLSHWRLALLTRLASWRSKSRRSINSSASNPHRRKSSQSAMSNPLGVLLANSISPQLVRSVDHVPYLNILTAVPSVVVMIVAFVGVTSSEPKRPPSASAADKETIGFVDGLKACFGSRQYLILFLVMGGGVGMFNCLYTVMQELLCPSGYGNTFSGLCASLMIVGGLVGATVSSFIVDRFKVYEETMKIAMGLAVVFGLIFMQLTLHPGLAVLIALTCVCFGVLGLATYPVGLELSVECTHPVSEATATGLIVLSGQIQSVLYVMIMKQFSRPLQPDRMDTQVCTLGKGDHLNHPKDSTQSVMAFSIIAAVLVLILVIFFKPEYKRMSAEMSRAKADKAKEEEKLKKEIGLPDQERITQPLKADI